MAIILIIDDDIVFSKLTCSRLEKEGHTVFTVEDGRSGLFQLKMMPAALVITDILMPGGDGLQIIIDLRVNFSRVKIIAVSGTKELLASAESLGAHAVLVKPVSKEDLISTVNRLLH